MNESIFWWAASAADIDEDAVAAATWRQGILTKPPGALGRLEALAIQLAGMQGHSKPEINRIDINVFAADHGVVVEGVSAFPQVVTYEMVKNFASGGAAINVLARALGANLKVINLGTVVEAGELPGVVNHLLGPGTANIAEKPAMSDEQFQAALQVGRIAALEAQQNKADLFIGGEMGIGNTTSAAAICSVLLGVEAAVMAGPGTGLDSDGVLHKVTVIEKAIALHSDKLNSPAQVLQVLGGFEIAALAGSYIACAQQSMPVLVDGFISSCAALCASRMCVGSEQWFIYAHASAEPGHRIIMEGLGAEPILDLGMRLGEGSGAAVAVTLLKQACALHNEMATFEEAGVSEA
ncbi:MAG: nicotinate-nucleotide--dimethylbenzimidazole phosphoribosyltransferase [Planctomycetota bacterium]